MWGSWSREKGCDWRILTTLRTPKDGGLFSHSYHTTIDKHSKTAQTTHWGQRTTHTFLLLPYINTSHSSLLSRCFCKCIGRYASYVNDGVAAEKKISVSFYRSLLLCSMLIKNVTIIIMEVVVVFNKNLIEPPVYWMRYFEYFCQLYCCFCVSFFDILHSG